MNNTLNALVNDFMKGFVGDIFVYFDAENYEESSLIRRCYFTKENIPGVFHDPHNSYTPVFSHYASREVLAFHKYSNGILKVLIK